MDKADFIRFMGDIAVFMDDRDSLNDHLSAIAPGAYSEIGGRFLDSYIEVLSRLVGDSFTWIDWFVFENDMGASGLKAGYDNKEKRIKTLDDLWWLIEEGKKHEN